MTTRSDDHEFIEPLQVDLGIDGKLVSVRPLVVRDIPRVLELAAPLLRQLSMFDDGAVGRFRAGKPDEKDLATLLSVVAVDADDVFKVVAICAAEPEEWIATRLPDRFARLVAVCIEVNRDFFSRLVPPALARALAGLDAHSATAPPSSSS